MEVGTGRCPYCGNEGAAKPVSPTTDAARTVRFLLGVCGACLFLYAAALVLDFHARREATDLFGGPSLATWARLGALDPAAVTPGGEWWRLVTSIFVHFGALHVLLNLGWIVHLAPICANTFGHDRTVALYVGGGVAGSLGSLATLPPEVIGGGASGAVCALVGGLLAFALRRRSFEGRILRDKMVRDSIFLVVWSLAMYQLGIPIGHAAHVAGWAGGFAIGWYAGDLAPPGGRADRAWRAGAWASYAALAASAAFVVVHAARA